MNRIHAYLFAALTVCGIAMAYRELRNTCKNGVEMVITPTSTSQKNTTQKIDWQFTIQQTLK